MKRWSTILVLSSASLAAYLLTISSAVNYFPQIIALITLIFFGLHLSPATARLTDFTLGLIAFTISFIVFATGGLNSPIFFLTYFLLFTLAFQHQALVTLIYAIVLVILFAQSLDSLTSLLPLTSILFISPLAWFVAQEHADNLSLKHSISKEETSTFFWLTLKFKNTIITIIDIATHLLNDPRLTPTHITQLQAIKKHAQTLLSSSKSLISDFDNDSKK